MDLAQLTVTEVSPAYWRISCNTYDDKTGLVLHPIDEQIHHGAALGVLRDLYRTGFKGNRG
jgi:hypothetical protein